MDGTRIKNGLIPNFENPRFGKRNSRIKPTTDFTDNTDNSNNHSGGVIAKYP
jgi:hypothetical protein